MILILFLTFFSKFFFIGLKCFPGSYDQNFISGTVNLYLDGTMIASAGPTSMKTATFDYSNGNELKLDENNGIIRFEDFKISNYEGKQI